MTTTCAEVKDFGLTVDERLVNPLEALHWFGQVPMFIAFAKLDSFKVRESLTHLMLSHI